MPTRIVLKDTPTGRSLTSAARRASQLSPRIRETPTYTGALQPEKKNKKRPTPALGSANNQNNNTNSKSRSSSSRGNSNNNNNNSIIGSSPLRSSRASQRTIVVGFRSSILREALSSTSEQDRQQQQQQQQRQPRLQPATLLLGSNTTAVGLSTDDIRASPRLLGYLFSLIASSVLLVSVVQFYRSGQNADKSVVTDMVAALNLNSTADTTNTNTTGGDEGEGTNGRIGRRSVHAFFISLSGSLVYEWKLWGALYFAAANVGLCLATLLVHFDTVLAPNLWMVVFRDGSLAERNWLLFMILIGLVGVFLSTSSLSVGESQANVYFTAWISFGSICLNYGVWRESAGYVSLSDKVLQHRRETTYNWMWTAVFSLLFAGASTDIFLNRFEIELRYRGQMLNLNDSDWTIVLAVVWSELAVCVLAIIINEYCAYQLRCSNCGCRSSSNNNKINKREEEPGGMEQPRNDLSQRQQTAANRDIGATSSTITTSSPCSFGWQEVEGILILLAMVSKFWIVLKYTGVDGVINGLSNSYFGVWGSFFNSVFCFGTWLREFNSPEYVATTDEEAAAAGLQDDEENDDDDDASDGEWSNPDPGSGPGYL